MAGGKTKRSKSNDVYFKAYDYEKNKKVKLERHSKTHPNDTQAQTRPKAVFPEKPKSISKFARRGSR